MNCILLYFIKLICWFIHCTVQTARQSGRGREAVRSTQFSAEVKNVWRYTSIPTYALIAQGEIYFLFILEHLTLTVRTHKCTVSLFVNSGTV